MAYIVAARAGDTLCSVAIRNGYSNCGTVRSHAANAQLLDRPLQVNDQVTIPQARNGWVYTKLAMERRWTVRWAWPTAVPRPAHATQSREREREAAMLVIRRPQIDALGAGGEQRFAAAIETHVREFFPAQCAALSHEALQAACAWGVARARAHGLVTEQDLCKYVNVMFVFGRDFDADPRLPWAQRHLADARIGPTLRINRLYLDALAHEHEGAGLFPRGTARAQ